MFAPHLTADQAERFHRLDLDNEELERIVHHLDECPQCRRQYLAAPGDTAAARKLEADLLQLAWEEESHLDEEQIFALAAGTLESGDQTGLASHLEQCASCRAEVQRFRMERDRLMESHEQVVAPLPEIAVRDISGRVVLDGNRVQLEGGRKLPAAASGWIHQLLTEGNVAPSRAVNGLRSRLQDAATLVPAFRNSACSLVSPVNTVIRSRPSVLRWTPIPDAEDYTLVVIRFTNRNVRRVWKGDMGQSAEGHLPPEVQLETNQLYLWQVTAMVQGIATKSDFAWFSLLSADAAAEVEQRERESSDSALILLGVCEKHGLYEEAQIHLHRLMELNAESAQVRHIAAGLDQQRTMKREPACS